MQPTKSYGIILRAVEGSPFILLLDHEHGIVDAYLKGSSLSLVISQGFLIEYELRPRGKRYSIGNVAYIAAPAAWAAPVSFLHHVLEVADFFVPHADPCVVIYFLLCQLYKPYHHTENFKFLRLSFLCRFFYLLSWYPENHTNFSPALRHLISQPLETMVNDRNEELCQEEMQLWLHHCYMVHPQAHKLKTTQFFI